MQKRMNLTKTIRKLPITEDGQRAGYYVHDDLSNVNVKYDEPQVHSPDLAFQDAGNVSSCQMALPYSSSDGNVHNCKGPCRSLLLYWACDMIAPMIWGKDSRH